VDADALGAEAHSRLHRAFHCATERHAAFKLLGDRFGNQLRVKLWLADLDDVDNHIAVGKFGDDLAQLLDIGTLFDDNQAGSSRMDRYPAFLVRTLDHDVRHRRLFELFHQLIADLDIFMQQRAVFGLAGEPPRIPGAINADTQPDWIDFLTHRLTP